LCAADAHEALRRISAQETASNEGLEEYAMLKAQQDMMDMLVYERWCPHTGAGASSF
jgi:hypothetical protein